MTAGGDTLFDCDVRVTWRSTSELLPYLPRVWQSRVRAGRGVPRIQPAFFMPRRGFHKEAATPDAKAPPGSDLDTLGRDWLDRHDFERAVVGHEEVPVISTWGDVDYPVALARAHNEWLVERWLSCDARLLGAVVVATQDPAAAAQEIDRAAASSRQVVQVVLTAGTNRAYGTPLFRPIFDAAARNGLQVAIRVGTEGLGTSNPPTSAGWPEHAIEWRACQPQNLMAHLVSLVTEGVFVQFPELRVVLLDGGATWLPPLLWRLDKNYKSMRAECPWLTELPSAYLLRHVRFTTHRLERPEGLEGREGPDALWTYLRMMEGERALLYASGYPAWDMAGPAECQALQTASPDARRRIAAENARELYAARLGA